MEINGKEITPHFCEMVTKLAPHKVIGNDRFYLLGHIRRPEAEKVAKEVKSFGYNTRIIDDFGTAVYIKKSVKKGRK